MDGDPAAGAAGEAAGEDEEWDGEEEAWPEDALDEEDEEEEELLGPRALPVDGEPDFESVRRPAESKHAAPHIFKLARARLARKSSRASMRLQARATVRSSRSLTALAAVSQGPPADGLEYLRRVRWEAAQSPSMTRAEKIDPRKFDRCARACRSRKHAAARPTLRWGWR